MEAFIRSIFYVGRGSDSRRESHFVEPENFLKYDSEDRKLPENDLSRRILRTWENDSPVLILTLFEGINDEEARTREAIMIGAITTE